VKREAYETSHEPVLLNEVLHFLPVKAGGVYIDGTVGGGGHAETILQRMDGRGTYIAIDRDLETLERARERLRSFERQVHFVHGVFSQIPKILKELRIKTADGVLIDLGFSSFQLDTGERGFSFLKEGPLDMRMDPSGIDVDGHGPLPTAAEIVNEWPEKDLAEIFYKFGEERFARRIARAIVAVRRGPPFEKTTDLSRLIEKTVPRGRHKIHPATRVFQALRIAVNGELDHLEKFLSADFSFLNEGSRIIVISFHSLEDRLVKRSFRSREDLKVVTKKPVTATVEELRENPRSRSAKLRVAEKAEKTEAQKIGLSVSGF